MKAYACPPHVSLARTCAQHILTEHKDRLPDLTGLTVLVPGPAARTPLRTALQAQAAEAGIPGLLLPEIKKLRPWVLAQAPEPCPESALSELLDFATLLGKMQTTTEGSNALINLGPAEPWTVASELLYLFEALSLNGTPLPDEQDVFLQQLQEKYAIPGIAPQQLEREAEIVFRLWHAWNSGSSGTLEHYCKTLRTIQAPDDLQALYVCGFEELAILEMECLNQLATQIPVALFTRTYHRLPGLTPEVIAGEASERAQVLEQIFDIDSGKHLRERAVPFHGTVSPLADWLQIFRAEHSEPHVHGIDIQIRQWIAEGHHNIGLITEDRKAARRMRALLERAGIGIHDYSGWALSTTSAATAIDRWLSCLREQFPHQMFLDLLKSPFCRPGALPDHIRAVSRFEQILRKGNYFQNTLSKAQKYLNNQPDPDARDTDCLALLDATAQAAAVWRKLPEQSTAGQYFATLLASLDILGCLSALRCDAAGQKIFAAIDDTVYALRQNTTALPHAQWQALLYRVLEQGNYAPRAENGMVTLVSLHEAHLCEFDHLIVAGMDTRHYPKPRGASFLFNDKVREELGLPVNAVHQRLERQRFQTLMLATDAVLCTWQSADGGEPQIESPWLAQIQLFHQQAYDTKLESDRLRALAYHPDTWVAPNNLPPARADWQMPAPSIPVELVPERMSPNGHQKLIDCPYQFYARYALGLREREPMDEELNAMDFGNFVHKCLAAFYSEDPALPGPWQQTLADDAERKAARKLLREIGDTLILKEPRYEPFAEELRPQWRATIEVFLKQESSAGGASVDAVECKREKRISNQLTLFGIIDRIDHADGDTYALTDYKTGKIDRQKKLMPLGEEVQLPSYALIVDGTTQVQYRSLKKDPRAIVALDAQALEALVEQTRERLTQMHDAMRAGQPLPAHGDETVCEHCPASGLCRRQMWCDSAAL